MRIPVGVVDDDDVSGCQIDAETAGTGAQHEDELGAVGLVVGVDGFLEGKGNKNVRKRTESKT